MKTLFFLAGLLSVGFLFPLHAQAQAPSPADSGNGTTTTTRSVPALPRNINPVTINHKPNPVAPPPEIAAPIDKFFKGLKTGDYATAYETFLTGSRLGLQKEKVSFFISKTEEAFGLYGALNDYEIFDNYSVGSNVLVLTYLSRHSVQPLRWRFIYYRPDKTWGLINMGFDDFLLDMLD